MKALPAPSKNREVDDRIEGKRQLMSVIPTRKGILEMRWHLTAALLTVLLGALALFGAVAYAESVESDYVDALAPIVFPQKSLGSALQRAALRKPDILLLFGSSELRSGGEYQGGEFFKTYPTGFGVFLVGQHAASSLIFTQMLSGNSDALPTKKIAISLTPDFFQRRMADLLGYSFNFSRLDANTLAFNTDLSFGLKHDIAKRMLQYPTTLKSDPLLELALKFISDGSPPSRLLYYAILPVGKIQTLVLKLQDHWELLQYISENQKLDRQSLHALEEPDWGALANQTEAQYKLVSDNNPFGVANSMWSKFGKQWRKAEGSLTDEKFLNQIDHTLEWDDLELLLRTCQELQVKPLILSMPIHGEYYDYLGVSASARNAYYRRLEALALQYGAAVQDFHDEEYDPYFATDMAGHMSEKGWVLYDQTLDEFYHDRFY